MLPSHEKMVKKKKKNRKKKGFTVIEGRVAFNIEF